MFNILTKFKNTQLASSNVLITKTMDQAAVASSTSTPDQGAWALVCRNDAYVVEHRATEGPKVVYSSVVV